MKTPNESPVSMRNRGVRFLRCAVFAALILVVPARLTAGDGATAYDSWTKSWAERPATSPALGGAELKAIITIITGELNPDSVAGMTPVDRLKLSYRIKVAATEVTGGGKYRSYFVSNTDSLTAVPQELSAEKMQKLETLLAGLPDDHAQLPPAGRRVVVQTRDNGAWRVRVYDGHQLPAEIQAVMDLLANPYASQL